MIKNNNKIGNRDKILKQGISLRIVIATNKQLNCQQQQHIEKNKNITMGTVMITATTRTNKFVMVITAASAALQ